MRHTTIAVAAFAALIGGAALAVTAQGQDQTPQTITFTAGEPARRDIKQIDIKPRGESLGDQNIGAVTVRRNGKPIGRLLSQCTAMDASYEGQMCTITLLTRDGQIIAQGAGEHRALPGHGGNPGTGDVFRHHRRDRHLRGDDRHGTPTRDEQRREDHRHARRGT